MAKAVPAQVQQWYDGRAAAFLAANEMMPANAEMLRTAQLVIERTVLVVATPNPSLRMLVASWGHDDGEPPPAPITSIEGRRWPLD